MGSKFFSIHIVDPAKVRPALQGDEPGLVERVYAHAQPPDERLRPVFELMQQGLLVFVCGTTREDGILYTQATHWLLNEAVHKRTDIEFYPDEGEGFWSLVWDKCEAPWLDMPVPEYEIGRMAYRSPQTCGDYARSLPYRSHNERYSPTASVDEAVEFLREAKDTGFGAFITYIG